VFEAEHGSVRGLAGGLGDVDALAADERAKTCPPTPPPRRTETRSAGRRTFGGLSFAGGDGDGDATRITTPPPDLRGGSFVPSHSQFTERGDRAARH